MTQTSDFVTTEEAAEQLGVTMRHIQRWCKDGTLKALKVSAKRSAPYIIPLKEFNRFKLQQNKKRAKLPSGSPAR